MAKKFSPRVATSSEDERFETKRTVSFTTIVNGVEVEFDVTLPWAQDRESDEPIVSDVAAEAHVAGAERTPPSA